VKNAIKGVFAMRKRRVNPKIVRVGDTVKVINPVVINRVGYPLSVDDCAKEIEQIFTEDIENLIYRSSYDDELTNKKIEGVLWYPSSSNHHSRSFYRIVRELAYQRLKSKGFGGDERKLFTEVFEPIRNRIYKVKKIIIRVSGTYNKAYGGYSYNGEYDYEPAYLSDSKVHKILVLNTTRTGVLYDVADDKGEYIMTQEMQKMNEFEVNLRPIQIETINVEKVANEDMSNNVSGLVGE
jgi:hypothetical protein